ncbi:carboxymuconolactone decarboxylase family protein [Klebsiella sp. WOUb02]|uniref:carboxymuconolactone decarboxylase family protein n=1 Tax=Klebsiella sp. WOUb02 TaxID=3161071 RepID=UPI003CEBA290
MNSETRYECRPAKLQEIDGDVGERVLERLNRIVPVFARNLIEFPFGGIYSIPIFVLNSREIVVVAAALTTPGNSATQIKRHIQGAINIGVSHTEVIETIIPMAVYAEFTAVLNGLSAARRVFIQRGAQ